MGNWVDQLIDSALEWSWWQWFLKLITSSVFSLLLLFFFGLLLWLFLLRLFLSSFRLSLTFLNFTFLCWFSLFRLLLWWFLIDFLFLVIQNLGFLLLFLSFLHFRNDGVSIFVDFVHFLFVLKSFGDLVDGSVNDVDEWLKWIFIERVDLWQVWKQEID